MEQLQMIENRYENQLNESRVENQNTKPITYSNNYFRKLRAVYRLMKECMPNHDYHNQRHGKDVFYTVNKLAKIEGISMEKRFWLATGALLHDIIFVKGAKDNEERSAEFAAKFLPLLGYSHVQIYETKKLIRVTEVPTHPLTLLEKIICDADVDNLGRKDFLERGDEVRKELGIEPGRKWYEAQLKFLQNHHYYTNAAKQLRDQGLQENIRQLEKMLGGV